MYGVVCFGSAVLDILVKSPHFKVIKSHQVSGGVAMAEVYGGKMDVDVIKMESGGGATNVGTGLTRLGVRCGSVFKLTRDNIGTLIAQQLAKEGLDTTLAIKQVEGDSAISVILVANDGGRSILTYRGASGQLTSSEIDWGKTKSRWFYISSLGGQMELLEDLFAFAKQNGINVAFNPGRGELQHKVRLLKLLDKCSILFMNRLELSNLVEAPYESDKKLIGEARNLKAELVVITEGNSGARVITKTQQIRADSFKVKSIDDTGAGDAFSGAFLAGIVQEKSLDVCLKMGIANGASVVGEIGAKAGLLNEKEMNKWLKKILTIVEEPLL